ncbi:hypothetical protein GCM10008955_36930 [Deinococcus malanensis]|uniref:Acyltransferase 3 domain-containing protein n=2 Tax=Deinococcus malanensis TaxID=1706855 RepID=A0ABQ2F4C9_9DEIO|nr:hypothetical protein GCM10008955_36930 [Deinococcus malanensis]
MHVVLYHYGLRTFEGAPFWVSNILHSGYVGVTLFFVLSGFILTYVYLDADARRTVDARKFWIARVARIYPVYLLGLLLWLPFFIGKASGDYISPLTAWLTGLTAPLALQAWIPNTACVWNCPSWSVSVEAFFYLLFPLLAALLYPKFRVATSGAFALTFLGLWLLSLLPPTAHLITERSGSALGTYEPWLNAVKFNPLTRLPEFLMGLALGKFYLTRRAQGRMDVQAGTILGPVVALALLLILAFSGSFPYVFLHNGLLAPLFAALIYALATGKGVLTAVLSVPFLVLLGEASYSMYIFHAPLWDWLYKFSNTAGIATNGGTSLSFLLVYLALIVGVSILTFKKIEIPARDVLRNVLSGKPARSPAVPRDASVPTWRFNPRRPEFITGVTVGLVAAAGLLLHPLLARAESPRSTLPAVATAQDAPGRTGNLLDPAALARGVEAAGWRPAGGRWTAQDGAVVQEQTEGYDLALLSTGIYQPPYTFRVALRNLQGNGDGIMFNAPLADSKNGAQLVRYTDDGSGLFWGHFDQKGDFIGAGFAQTLPPQKAGRHVLEIQVGTDSYSIVLDGRQLAKTIPLRSRAGHIGLTTSVGSAAFDSAEVTVEGAPSATTAPEMPDPAPAPTAESTGAFREPFTGSPEATGWAPVGGSWQLQARTFAETTEEGYDQVLLSPRVFQAPFVLTARFRNLTGNGGGVIFGSPEGESRTGRQLVRYSDDGTTLTWGYFNEQGDYEGQGSAPTTPPGTELHTLRVEVGSSTYAVLLDGKRVAQDVPLQTKSGRVGMQSSAGTVAFEAFEVDSAATGP